MSTTRDSFTWPREKKTQSVMRTETFVNPFKSIAASCPFFPHYLGELDALVLRLPLQEPPHVRQRRLAPPQDVAAHILLYCMHRGWCAFIRSITQSINQPTIDRTYGSIHSFASQSKSHAFVCLTSYPDEGPEVLP